jgi:hypothetical protein
VELDADASSVLVRLPAETIRDFAVLVASLAERPWDFPSYVADPSAALRTATFAGGDAFALLQIDEDSLRVVVLRIVWLGG